MAKDYYDILGVSKSAGEAEIKKAFRELAHKHHPDKEGGNAEKFKEINAAYQVLGDPKKRAQYDQFGSAAFEQGGGAGGGFGGFQGANFENMGDIGEMFGDIFGFGRQGGGSRQRNGRDIEMNVRLGFEEAVFGAEKQVDLYKPVRCGRCDGAGVEPGSKMVTCETCKGQGRMRQVQRTILGNFESVVTCGSCNGAGNVPEKSCKDCSGSGVKRESKRITVKIPAGIDDGETIRIGGEGEAAPKGGRSGDLYLHVKVEDDDRFERHGADIYGDLEIGFAEAALGAEREVETVDGALELKIPAGIQSGEEIRLKARGVPRLNGSGRGDHFVRVTVVTPRKLSRKAKELLEQLKDEEV
jgi:molecular chaperone DnaJ